MVAVLNPIKVCCLKEIVSEFSYPQMFIFLFISYYFLQPIFLQEDSKAAYKNANTMKVLVTHSCPSL